MVERGILFKDRLVRRILAGAKHQTRRLVTLPPWLAKMGGDISKAWPDMLLGVCPGLHVPCADGSVQRLRNPWGFIPPILKASENADGQPVNLWVREAHAIESNYGIDSEQNYPPPFSDGRPIRRDYNDDDGEWWEQCHYRATDPTPELSVEGKDGPGVRWRPSMFMPRWASRILLRVVSVRAERLQDISEADAIAEGVRRDGDWFEGAIHFHPSHPRNGEPALFHYARDAFASLWDSINGRKAGAAWADSPFVWRIEFERTTT